MATIERGRFQIAVAKSLWSGITLRARRHRRPLDEFKMTLNKVNESGNKEPISTA